MEMLHEEIKKIAAHQEELYQALYNQEKVKEQQNQPPKRTPLKDDRGRYICYNCGEPEHTSRRCSQRVDGRATTALPLYTHGAAEPAGNSSTEQRPDSHGPSMIRSQTAECVAREVDEALRRTAFGSCRTVELAIASVKTTCLWDTGSMVTTITEAHFREHFGEKEMSANWVELTAVNGLDIPLLGCIEAEVELIGKTVGRMCILVLTDNHPDVKRMNGLPGIVGMNVIEELEARYMTEGELKKMDKYIPARGEAIICRVLATVKKEAQCVGPDGKIGFVKLAGRQAVTIPPFSEIVVEGRSRASAKVKCEVLVEATPNASLPRGVLVANVLAETTGGKIPVRIMNTSKKTIKLMPRSRVATISKPKEALPGEVVEFEENEGVLHVKGLKSSESQAVGCETAPLSIPVQVNTDVLMPPQCQQLSELLARHRDVFSRDEHDCGYTTTVSHNIPTGDAAPVK